MSTLSQFLGGGGGDVVGSTTMLAPPTSPALMTDGNSYYVRTGTSVAGLPKSTLNAVTAKNSDFAMPLNPITVANDLVSGGDHSEIVFGNGVYIRATNFGTLRSTDGVNWTPVVFSTSFGQGRALCPVVCGNGRFATVVGYTGQAGSLAVAYIASSADGIDWTIVPVAQSNNNAPESGAVSPGVISFAGGFFHYGYSLFSAFQNAYLANLQRSSDALEWVRITAVSTGNVNDTGGYRVTQLGTNLFASPVSVPTGGGGIGFISTNNGAGWTQISIPGWFNNGLSAIKFLNGQGIALTAAGSSTTTQIYTSPDGNTWTARTSVNTSLVLDVAYGAGLYVVVGAGGTIQTSPDGITWTQRTSGATGTIYAVEFDSTLGTFIALQTGSANVLKSTNGTTWTTVSVPALNRSSAIAAYADSIFIARLNGQLFLTGKGDCIMTTSDATTFSRVLALGTPNNSANVSPNNAVGPGNSMLCDVGGFVWFGSDTGGLIRISKTDGTMRQVIDSAVLYQGVAFRNGTFVAVGSGGNIQSSTDGITWTARTSGTANNLIGVVAGSRFVAVTNTNQALHSVDGITWTIVALGHTPVQLAHANGYYYIRTTGGWILVSNDGFTWVLKSVDGSFGAMKPWSRGVILFSSISNAVVFDNGSFVNIVMDTRLYQNVFEIGSELIFFRSAAGYVVVDTNTMTTVVNMSTISNSPISLTNWNTRGQLIVDSAINGFGQNIIRIGTNNSTLICHIPTGNLSANTWGITTWTVSDVSSAAYSYLSGVIDAVDTPSLLMMVKSDGLLFVPKLVLSSASPRIAPTSTDSSSWTQGGSGSYAKINVMTAYRKIS